MNLKQASSDIFLMILLGTLGVVSIITAILIAWPALAYIAAKLTM